MLWRRTVLLGGLALATGLAAPRLAGAQDAPKETPAKNPVVVLTTRLGVIEIELDAEKAPLTARNFVDYVKAKHYDGTLFHRVIPDFMIQGGGYTEGLKERKTRDPIKNEAANGLKNVRGTIAMARTPDPNSATAQFFINVKDNDFLNHREATPQGYGYAVFGKVIKGMDVVDKIVGVKTTSVGGHQNVPAEDVVIRTARLKEAK